MSKDIYTSIGEIIDFEVHLLEGEALSASMEIKVNDEYVIFGGQNLFSSIPNSGVDLVGHFIQRCFQVSAVDKTRDLEGHLLKVAIEGDFIIGIASLVNEDFFYPAQEFPKLSAIR
ncbi:hypothetical protein [Dyadobacter fanqingshengii]|uniref:Uncharacterized protein n=1 Tax=Dyadobacter fanqingshengii TaxID=2906443 RepID=A0A9X1PHX2_9BACT|nr:hypothetical protein [Dyadobacter fanqingshengii]MCF0043647.1 hypothetical protein [Dyadobacter fanqingshengii]USJ34737.1 hypothetical protein NFI81_18740 [Dyadobacter fanqingshengii]